MVPAVCALLALAAALVFGRAVQYEFVNFDDDIYLYENPWLADGPTAEAAAWAFTGFYAANWHPLTWLSHLLDVRLYGFWAGGHHLTNVLLHAVNAILLFLVLRRMTGRLWPSGLAAALFAIHPLHVESVAWVSERKDVLSGLCFMLTLAAYLGYVRRPFSLPRYLLVVLCFALGLLAKPMLVTLPLVLLLLDYWPLGRWRPSGDCPLQPAPSTAGGRPGFPWRLFIEKVPLLLLAAASCAVTLIAQSTAVVASEQLPWNERLANAVVSYARYLGQSFWPACLAVWYPHPQHTLPWWTVAGCAMFLLGASLLALIWRRSYPYLLVGWLWYLGMLVPVIGLVQVGSQARADRYMYLPLIGLSLAVAWGAAQFADASADHRRACGIVAATVLSLLGGCAWQQVSYWQDSETLWTHTLECTSRNCVAYGNLGLALARKGRTVEAILNFREAIAIKPDQPELHYHLGDALAVDGRVDEAILNYQEALLLDPDYAAARKHLGFLLATRGRTDEPGNRYPEAHYELGNALAECGRLDEAAAHYQAALAIRPDFAEAHNNLGILLAECGQLDQAIAHYQAALRSAPDSAKAHNNLGNALVRLGRIEEAAAHYRKALEIQPDDADARRNLDALRGRTQE
jgi:tetratricopeptide (TPR) repeat protein